MIASHELMFFLMHRGHVGCVPWWQGSHSSRSWWPCLYLMAGSEPQAKTLDISFFPPCIFPCTQDAATDVHCPPASALGLSSLALLCQADVLDFYKAWKVRKN